MRESPVVAEAAVILPEPLAPLPGGSDNNTQPVRAIPVQDRFPAVPLLGEWPATGWVDRAAEGRRAGAWAKLPIGELRLGDVVDPHGVWTGPNTPAGWSVDVVFGVTDRLTGFAAYQRPVRDLLVADVDRVFGGAEFQRVHALDPRLHVWCRMDGRPAAAGAA